MRMVKVALVTTCLFAIVPVTGQVAKELKTKKGASIALVNLLNAKPDCSSNMNPIAVPVVRQSPANGAIKMTVQVANVAAAGNCPARRVPVITLIYSPKPDFVGTDAATIEVDSDNQSTSLSYRISVIGPGESL